MYFNAKTFVILSKNFKCMLLLLWGFFLLVCCFCLSAKNMHEVVRCWDMNYFIPLVTCEPHSDEETTGSHFN